MVTQSPLLVHTFDLDEILVLDLENGQTRFRRLDPGEYRQRLDESFTSRAVGCLDRCRNEPALDDSAVVHARSGCGGLTLRDRVVDIRACGTCSKGNTPFPEAREV